MYDNLCKYLIEQFPEDFAQWLLGEAIDLAILHPKELSNEPIRADSLVLLQSKKVILHGEFQTRPDPYMSFRMLDYFTRIYRKFPHKRIHQVVVYLFETNSPLVNEDCFKAEKTRHQFNVVRLWEQPSKQFMSTLGLMPLATLAQCPDQENPEQVLRQVAQQINDVENEELKANLTASTALLAGLKLDRQLIYQLLRSDVMKESVIYQDILQTGEQQGIEKGLEQGIEKGLEQGIEKGRRSLLLQILPILRRLNVPVEQILNVVGVTLAELEQDDTEDQLED